MDDWKYCLNTLPKVSRTFALNIAVLRGELHRSVLIAYLFCRTIDTVEDAGKLDPKLKIQLLLEFARLIQNRAHREKTLERWIADCRQVDGSPQDLDLIAENQRVFRVFDSLPQNHQDAIVQSVSQMAVGMAYFQKRFHHGSLVPLKSEEELEEYCYFVAGAVGEMLCNLFLLEMPGISEAAAATMRRNAVSFGLGLQMTNISKDVVVDRERGWSYIPEGLIREQGLTVEEFHAGLSEEKNLQILEALLRKTSGHLRDALAFTLAIPRTHPSIRLFCIWPLWMAVETVAVLHNNPVLLSSRAAVKISRATVKRILWTTPFLVFSNGLLTRSFENRLDIHALKNPPRFNLDSLKERLEKIPLDSVAPDAQPA